MRRPTGILATVLLLAATIAVWLAPPASATSSCPAASPNDSTADDAALQACLNAGGSVTLDPGTPGYILSQGLTITQSNTTITSSVSGQNATIVAAPSLDAPLLLIPNIGESLSGVTISYITFDGNRPNRTDISNCSGSRQNQSSIVLKTANAFDFEHNTITRTVCGSALNLDGSSMTVAFNTLTDNGHGREAKDASEPWSDGMTIAYCNQGNIHDNQITDASDVGIVLFSSANCNVHNNTITQVSRHAFAGAQFGAPAPGVTGDHTGSTIQSNSITGNGLLSFGVAYGIDPWFNALVEHGNVLNNTVSGAIVNLLVDGAKLGQVGQNSLSAPSGTPLCPASNNAPVNFDFDPDSAGTTVSSVPDAFRSYDSCIP